MLMANLIFRSLKNIIMIIGSQTSSFNAAMLRCLTFGPSCIHTSSNWSSDDHPAGEDACHNCIYRGKGLTKIRYKMIKIYLRKPHKILLFFIYESLLFIILFSKWMQNANKTDSTNTKIVTIYHWPCQCLGAKVKSVSDYSDYIAILLRRI